MKHAKAVVRERRSRSAKEDLAPGAVRPFDPSLVPAYAREALGVLLEAGKQAYLVGGFVRDALRGVAAHDVDIATDSLWYQTRDLFISRGYRVVDTGAKHGTVTVFVAGHPVEVTTFRVEGAYSDHRRPDMVRYVRNVEDDLARRDFTVNAMAWSPQAGLVDPFGGRDDMAARLVRAVGEPAKRFEEDALRVLRGVRFASSLGFEVEPATSQAIHDFAKSLGHVAMERVASEYDGLVRGANAVEVLRAYPDVAACAVPEIASMVGFDQRSKWHCYDVWEHCLHALELLPASAPGIVRHVTLLHDVGKPASFSLGSDGRGHFYGHEETGARMALQIFANLRWRRVDVEHASCLIRLHDHRIDPSPRGVRRILSRLARSFAGAEDMAHELFDQLVLVKRADTMAHAPSCTARRMREIDQACEAYAEVVAQNGVFCMRDLAIGGNDVVMAGVPRGPEVGRVLRRLLAQVVDGELQNEREALIEAVRTR